MNDEEPITVRIHPALLEEFKIKKEVLESKLGYKINGGNPVISMLCAEILKRERLKDKKIIRIEAHKKAGTKKTDIIFV